MELAAAKLFRAKWTDQIQEEWIEKLIEGKKSTREKLDRTKANMTAAIPDCLITGYEGLIPSVICPDPDDRHVIAAAIKGKCSAIITVNLKDFPPAELANYDIEAQHPDEFIHHQFGLDQAGVLIAVKNCRLRLQKPKFTPDEYLDCLYRQGLPRTVNELSKYSTII